MKKPYFLLLLLFSCILKSQYLWQIDGEKITKWNYFDGDEFNNDKVDKSKWRTTLPWSRAVISQDIVYTDSNITFNDGVIQFAIKNEESWVTLADWEIDSAALAKNKLQKKDSKTFLFKYSGGLLYSHKEYLYGYFEIKFKAPTGKGIWPAFWLYGGKPNNEIDFFELKGEKEKAIHVDIHCPNGCSNYKEGWFGYRKGWGHWLKVDKKLNESYNVIAGEWTKEYIKWFLNGKLIAYSNHSFEIPMCLTAGTGIAKNGGPFKPGPDKYTPFPNNFYVDYIRIYNLDSLSSYNEISKNLTLSNKSKHKNVEGNLKVERKGFYNNKISTSKIITISLNQLSLNEISLRILGVKNTDEVSVEISSNEVSLFNKKTTSNSEYIIVTNKTKVIKLKAAVNNQLIEEIIEIK